MEWGRREMEWGWREMKGEMASPEAGRWSGDGGRWRVRMAGVGGVGGVGGDGVGRGDMYGWLDASQHGHAARRCERAWSDHMRLIDGDE